MRRMMRPRMAPSMNAKRQPKFTPNQWSFRNISDEAAPSAAPSQYEPFTYSLSAVECLLRSKKQKIREEGAIVQKNMWTEKNSAIRSAQPRTLGGSSSSTVELIELYSPPIPAPVMKRKTQKVQKSVWRKHEILKSRKYA
jgi:hypothetical protein